MGGHTCLRLLYTHVPLHCFLPHPEPRRGSSEFALECPIEGRLGFVTHISRNPCYAEAGGGQHPRTELQPPSRKISHGRFSQIMPEPVGEPRSRHPHPLGEIGNRPGVFRSAMHLRRRRSHHWIARSRKPARLLWRQLTHVTAQSLHK